MTGFVKIKNGTYRNTAIATTHQLVVQVGSLRDII